MRADICWSCNWIAPLRVYRGADVEKEMKEIVAQTSYLRTRKHKLLFGEYMLTEDPSCSK